VGKHILIFDSGLGGTTILHEIAQLLPHCQFSYALDNEAFPYSNKSDEYLQLRTQAIFSQLIPIAQPDLIVIACNTLSTLALDQLRQRFSLPFVGVVPAIKPAAALSKTKVIALLATQATVQRHYIEQLRITHAEQCQIIRLGSSRLVELAEESMQQHDIDQALIQEELRPLLEHPLHEQIDVFILGCTHFPAIKEALKTAWPHAVQWIDSGAAIARRVESICQTLENRSAQLTNTLYLTSKKDADKKLKTVEKFGINQCHVIKMQHA